MPVWSLRVPGASHASRLAVDPRHTDSALTPSRPRSARPAASHRRRGLARRVLAELEHRAAAAGYDRMYLTTGPRQPEARDLYLATGWAPLFDPAVPRPTDIEQLRALPVDQRLHAFTEQLTPGPDLPGDPG